MKLTVTDDEGASASVAKDVTVTASLEPPTAAFGLRCEGLDCTFTDKPADSDGKIAAWRWNFGDGAGSSGPHPRHT